MDEVIAFSISSVDGIVDCQLEIKKTDEATTYTVIILYPHKTDGINMSKVYEYNLDRDPVTGAFSFNNDSIHPVVQLLEKELSAAIIDNL